MRDGDPILRAAGCFDERPGRVLPVTRGGRKAVWRVDGARGALALKRMHRDARHATWVAALQAHAHARGAPVPEPVPARGGGWVVMVEGRVYTVTRWLEGARPVDLGDDHQLAAAAAALAAFHQAARGFAPPGGWSPRRAVAAEDARRLRRRWRRWRRACRRRAWRRLPVAALAWVRRRARALLRAQRQGWWRDLRRTARVQGQYRHGDVGAANLLTAGGRVWLLDLDGAAPGLAVVDLLLLVRHACRLRGPEGCGAAVAIARSAYETVRPLSGEERRWFELTLAFPWELLRAARRGSCTPAALRRALALDRARARAARAARRAGTGAFS